MAFIGAVMLAATLYSYTFAANEGRLFPQAVGWGTVALVLIFLVVARTPALRSRWGYFISEELIHFEADVEEEKDKPVSTRDGGAGGPDRAGEGPPGSRSSASWRWPGWGG